jgi:2-dehydro-3-deoxyglucarate aldolase
MITNHSIKLNYRLYEKIIEIKKNLRNGKATIGSWMQIANSSVAEIMGQSGYDWVAIDLEHGAFSLENLADIFRALELGGTLPFVRLPQVQPKDIKQALDTGAKGLIFPMIENKTQIENAISWALYPPKGDRGVGYSRANSFGKNFDEYISTSSELVLVAQIEHINAVQNLDEILGVSHLDAIITGPYDLSASMGITAQFEHAEFKKVLSTIQEKAKIHRVPMGIHVVQPDVNFLRKVLKDGYQFVAYSIDATFLYNTAQSPLLEKL